MDPKVMTCQESSGNLLARFRRELSSADSIRIDEHLNACGTCREEETEIESLAGMISSLPEAEPSKDSWSRMLMMIEESEAAPPLLRKRGRLVAFAAIFAASIAAACLLFLLPSSPKPPTLHAGPGVLLVNGDPVQPSTPIELEPGDVLTAGSMALANLSAARSMSLILATGTRLSLRPDGDLRLESGRIYATVLPGDEPVRFYAFGDTSVEVTGTIFDLVVNGQESGATVAVAEGKVQVRTGNSPVLVIQGQALHFGPGVSSSAPFLVNQRRIRDWCSTPTALLHRDGDLLRLTLRNDTVGPVAVKPFDPHQAVFSLLIEGPEIRLPVKIQERMVSRTGAAEQEFRTLAPGESYDLLLDPDALDLSRGTYRVSAVYKPYPPLPADVWYGPPLTTEALTLTVE